MSGLNQVVLIGRVGRDAEVRYTGSDVAVANFSIATSETWKDKQTGEKREKTQWHRISVFGRLAEVAGEYIRKGDLISVQGKIEYRKYEKDGVEKDSTEILASAFQFLAKSNNGEERTETRTKGRGGDNRARDTEPDFGDDIPF